MRPIKILTTILFLVLYISVNGQTAKKHENIALIICGAGYSSWLNENPVEKFEGEILSYLEVSQNSLNKKNIISNFFNENNPYLICENDTDDKIRDKEHIFKRSVARGEFSYLEFITQRSKDYNINFNFYEIIDGKKETLIDYIEKIINDENLSEDFEDIDDLKLLIKYIEYSGGKRGKDLIDSAYVFKDEINEGLHLVVDINNKSGFVNNKKELTIPLIYDYASPFEKGLSKVRKNGKYGYINNKNEIVIPIKYDRIFPFDGNEFTKVFLNGNIFKIDRKGNKQN